LVPVLSQMHPVHIFPLSFPKVHPNFIYLYMPRSYEWSLPFTFSNQDFVCIFHVMNAIYPTHLILLGLITLIIFHEVYKLSSFLLCILLQLPATSSLFGTNILLSVLFSYTLSLCFSLNVRDQVSHPHKATGKIMVLYTLIF
jgi:hypothetical protein